LYRGTTFSLLSSVMVLMKSKFSDTDTSTWSASGVQ
jgi:hypothetical protein